MSQRVTHVLLKGGVMLHAVGSRDEVANMINSWSRRFVRLIADLNGKDVPIDLNVDQVLLVESDHERGAEPVQSSDGTAAPVPFMGGGFL